MAVRVGKTGSVMNSYSDIDGMPAGASVDLLNEATRRMLVNAVYWCIGCEDKIPPTGTRVDLVGTYDPTKFEFRKDDYWASRNMAVDEFRVDDPAKK